MGAKKLIGYIISIVGIIIIALGVLPKFRTSFAFIPSGIKDLYIMLIGLIIVVVGIVLISLSGSSQKVSEVPIYHGKDVVGFRRLGKK